MYETENIAAMSCSPPVSVDSQIYSERPSFITQFVGRQPILELSGRTFGYELLYRAGRENCARISDGTAASATVIDAALTMGLELLCGGKRAFINCTEQLLVSRHIDLLPPESVVLEILESVRPTDAVLAACRELKQAGYMIALDDYIHVPERAALLPFADIVKIEPKRTPPDTIRALHQQCGPGVRLLAEKVETWEQVQSTSQAGCDLFQGYFFARPRMVEVRELRPFSATYLRIVRMLSAEEFKPAEVVQALKKEPSLCYRLLRYLNSCKFGFHNEIRSLSHALSLLGEDKFRKWLTIATIAIAGANTCDELLQLALVRARFCELLAPALSRKEEDLFFTGLLSLFNVVLNIPLEQLVDELAVSPEVRGGLLDSTTPAGQCRELVTAYCNGDWNACSEIADAVDIDETALPDLYRRSLGWAQELAI